MVMTNELEEFRVRAEDCEAKAAAARDEVTRRHYRDIAAYWSELAQRYEERYRDRANETRAAAERERDVVVKRTMLTIAAEYEHISGGRG
jgi:hypothetical protein